MSDGFELRAATDEDLKLRLIQLTRERDSLRAEVERLTRERDLADRLAAERKMALLSSNADNERLREALRLYGDHGSNCDLEYATGPDGASCTCGFTAALAGQPVRDEEKERLRAALRNVLDVVATYSFATSEHLPESRLGVALERARAALAGHAPNSPEIPDGSRREKAEAWLRSGPDATGTLAFHESPGDPRRALAERVREACAKEAEDYVEDADLCGVSCRDEVSAVGVHLRALDLDAVLGEAK